MKRLLIGGATLALLTTQAMAWSTSPVAPSPNQTQNQGQHQHQGQHQGQSQNADATGGAGGSVGGVSVSNGSGAIGGLSITVPDGAGNAPCGGGIGLGGLGLGGGGSGGGTLWEFGDCKRVRESAILRAMARETGDRRLEQGALNELCQIDRIKEAFGGDCPSLTSVEAVDLPKKYKFDYCYTASPGELIQHRECKIRN